MDSKAWYQSKTILAAIGVVIAGLSPFIAALGSWIDAGHTVSGAITVIWPAAVIFFGVLAGVFRAGATQPIK